MSWLTKALGRIAPQFRTVDDWIPIWLHLIEQQPITPKTILNRRAIASRFAHRFNGRRISCVRPSEISAFIRDLRNVSDSYANRALHEVRALFTAAIDEGWIDSNPAAHIRSPPARVTRQRMTLEQWRALLQHATSHGQPWEPHLIRLALVTGQRRGDLAKMRFDDVIDGWLHIEQQKTAARIALPVGLRMDAIDVSVADAIEQCRNYGVHGETMLRQRDGSRLSCAGITAGFTRTWRAAFGAWEGLGTRPTLHEIRSLSERLYRAQGIDTQTLLGHKRQSMTDAYNNDRGLSAGVWKRLEI